MFTKSLTNFLDVLTNSVLGLLLVGIVALATLSVVSLTPKPYESTIAEVENNTIVNSQNVLGIIDSNISGKNTLYKTIHEETPELIIKSFYGEEGYVAKIDAYSPSYMNNSEVMLVKVANSGTSSNEYLMTFNAESVLIEKYNVYAVVNGQKIQITTLEGEGKFAPFSLIPGSNVNLGFMIEPKNPGTVEEIQFEVMVIEL